MTGEEMATSIQWKKRADAYMLSWLKAEAILKTSEEVGLSVIAKMVEGDEKIIREWLTGWRGGRMYFVFTEHAGNRDVVKLIHDQGWELKQLLAQLPSWVGIDAGLRNVSNLCDVMKTWFDVECEPDSSCRLFLKIWGLSSRLPDSFDKRRDDRRQPYGQDERPSQSTVGCRAGGVRGRRGPPRSRGWGQKDGGCSADACQVCTLTARRSPSRSFVSCSWLMRQRNFIQLKTVRSLNKSTFSSGVLNVKQETARVQSYWMTRISSRHEFRSTRIHHIS